jgi:predicted permease
LRAPDVPRLAEALVRFITAHSDFRDAVLGDLYEGFARMAQASPSAASRWYWRRALSLTLHYLPSRVRPPRRALHVRVGDPSSMTFLNDLRFALRTLRRSPSFTIAAVLALGLGTGSAAGVFSLLQGVVLRPLPYPAPDQLVMMWERNHAGSSADDRVSPVNFGDYRTLTNVFQDAAAWWRPQINLTGDGGEPIRLSAIETTENLFSVLGVRPFIGSDFIQHPKLFGKENQAIISHRLWQSRFNGDRGIIGRAIQLNGFPYTVVGVMPSGFSYPGDTDLWQQLRWDPAGHSRQAHFMESVARLRPGVSADVANRELAKLSARLATENPRTNKDWAAHVVSLDREIAGVFRPALFALLGASALLLLIACINVANLLLARAVARRREVALRAAIGASRSRLIRLFLTESLVLAAIGAVLGLGIAVASVRGLLAWTPVRIPRADGIGVDFSVLVFATLIVVVTAVAFGLVPAVLTSRADLQDTMKDGAKGAGTRGRRLRNGLVVAEVALAVVLLSGAGLLIRSVTKLLDVNAGVDPTSVITVNLQLPEAGYRDWPRVHQFYAGLAQALRTNPEIVGVGAANFLPLDPGWRIAYQIAGAPAAEPPEAQFHVADEGYFPALRVPLVRGRFFQVGDDTASMGVVVVNEALVRAVFRGESPIGKRVVMSIRGIGPLSRRLVAGNEHEIVGVVKDIKNNSLRGASEPAVYFPQRQFPSRLMHLVVRGRGEPSRLAALVRQEVQRLDPALPLGDVKTMERVLAASVDPPRFVMLLMTVFAGLALTLAAVGIYGILTFMVTHRRREIGIRLALGAQPGMMLRMIVREGVGLTAAGCAIGVIAAFVAGRSLSNFLYGVEPWDPATIGGVLAVVLAVAVVACLVPGRRAASEDPASALRME